MMDATRAKTRKLITNLIRNKTWPTLARLMTSLTRGSKSTVHSELRAFISEATEHLAQVIDEEGRIKEICQVDEKHNLEQQIHALNQELLTQHQINQDLKTQLKLAFDRFESFENMMFQRFANTPNQAGLGSPSTYELDSIRQQLRKLKADMVLEVATLKRDVGQLKKDQN